eukprot:NODE_722_length_1227_cov_369.131579_g578_i0.p2 GENE.NODE_722_length_1227_cov_369.131579_g578_i0~~NODE_722_length_1227_cov_369.131579_g578_i0.p2  ORF type:complete len:175 (+),score=15.94 NODE_722_length_1227_cov_369.131579_g578_i0:73-597(+)
MTELRPRQPQGTSRMLQAAKPRVDNRGTKSSTLDFSFCDLNTVSDMYRVAPHSGQVKDLPQNQNAAPAEAEEERQQGAADDFADHDTRASHGSDKAKKKQRGRLTMFGNEEDEEADEEQQAQRTLQYHATSLKLDNNQCVIFLGRFQPQYQVLGWPSDCPFTRGCQCHLNVIMA